MDPVANSKEVERSTLDSNGAQAAPAESGCRRRSTRLLQALLAPARHVHGSGRPGIDRVTNVNA